MDALPYVDALIKEYLLFRGFQATLTSFTADLAADPGCGFQAERITDFIFRQLIPGLDCTALVEFLEFLNMQLYSRLDSRYERLVSAVEADLLRLFLVTAHRAGRQDAMADFLRLYGPQLISNSSSSSSSDSADWREWFLLPYLASPDREPHFQLYFSSEWAALLEVSFRNFIAGVVRSLPLPAVLRFNTDRRLRLALQQQVHALQSELERTKEQLSTALGSLQQQEQQQQQQQQQQLQQQQQQQQQQIGGSGMPDTTLHRREGSLTDWQHQPQGGLQHNSSSRHGQQEGRQHEAQQSPDKLLSRPIGGSGLFELLPQHSGALAAAAGTQPGLPQQQGLGYPQLGLTTKAKHVRGTSFSGSISFDALPALASEGPEGLAAEHSSDIQQQQLQQQETEEEQAEKPGRPIPQASGGRGRGSSSSRAAALPPALATTNLGLGPHSRSSPTGAVTLSSSPVMSWSGASSSSTGARPRHMPAGHAPASGGSSAGGGSGSGVAPAPPSPVAVQVLSAVPPSEPVGVSHQKHQAGDAAGDDAGVSVAAFSPSGGNVASVVAGSSCVHIWSPAGLPGANTARAAVVSCGAPVTCVSWDSRSDKLMLVGCAGGGGVRAWHSDTRRILDSVPAEPGFPVVAAVAACPSEPTFVVAANSSSSSSSGGSSQVHGRLVTYNARSFKRSSVLSVPGDAGLVSLAYSASGSQLLVGTAAGGALLYEPNSRSSPLRAWDVASAVARGKQQGARCGGTAVQVLWRPLGTHSSSGGGGAGGSMLTLCAGVLCEWLLSPAGSRSPVAAFDVLAAACDALSGLRSGGTALREQQGHSSTAGQWYCTAAVAPDGGSVAVLCSGTAAGVLLLLGATTAGGGSQPGCASWGARAHVLLCGEMLAGCAAGAGGAVSWHSGGRALVLGAGSGGGSGAHSITVTLPGGVLCVQPGPS